MSSTSHAPLPQRSGPRPGMHTVETSRLQIAVILIPTDRNEAQEGTTTRDRVLTTRALEDSRRLRSDYISADAKLVAMPPRRLTDSLMSSLVNYSSQAAANSAPKPEVVKPEPAGEPTPSLSVAHNPTASSSFPIGPSTSEVVNVESAPQVPGIITPSSPSASSPKDVDRKVRSAVPGAASGPQSSQRKISPIADGLSAGAYGSVISAEATAGIKPLEILPFQPLETLPSRPLQTIPSRPLNTLPSQPLDTFPTRDLLVSRAPYGSILALSTPRTEQTPSVILKIPSPSSKSNAPMASPQSELSSPPSTSSSATKHTEQTDNDVIDSRTQDLINALSSEPPARSLRPRKDVNYARIHHPYMRPHARSRKQSQSSDNPSTASPAKSRASSVLPSTAVSSTRGFELQFPVSGPIDATLTRLEQLYRSPPLAAPDPRRLSQASCTLIKVQAAHLAGILRRRHDAWLIDARRRFDRQQALNRYSVMARSALYASGSGVRSTSSEYLSSDDQTQHQESFDFEHEPLFNIRDLKADSTGTVKAHSLKAAMKKFMDQSNAMFMKEEKRRWAERQESLMILNAAICEGHLNKIDEVLKEDTVIEID